LPLCPKQLENKAPLQKLLKSPNAKLWGRSLTNKWGRLLAHGLSTTCPLAEQVKGTGTLFLSKNHKFSRTAKVTYANFICNIRPRKREAATLHDSWR
jgi:hypothetical protein